MPSFSNRAVAGSMPPPSYPAVPQVCRSLNRVICRLAEQFYLSKIDHRIPAISFHQQRVIGVRVPEQQQRLFTPQPIRQDCHVVFRQQPVSPNLYVPQQCYYYDDVAEQQQGIQRPSRRYAPAPPGFTPPTPTSEPQGRTGPFPVSQHDQPAYCSGMATATRSGPPEDGVVRGCTPPPSAPRQEQEEDLRLHMRRMVNLAGRNTDLAAQMAIIVAE